MRIAYENYFKEAFDFLDRDSDTDRYFDSSLEFLGKLQKEIEKDVE